jgi:hypothetical protein
MTARDRLRSFLSDPPSARVPFVLIERDGSLTAHTTLDPQVLGMIPGSFNPLHEGHTRLAAVAQELTQREVVYELSVTNVDKPPLAETVVRLRLEQFRGHARVVLTHATRFIEKARLFPGATFVVGWDTFARLIDARYYDGDGAAMHTAVSEMRDLGCHFLVAGRMQGGEFRELAPADFPREFAAMFEAIPESRFRMDVSSTALRGE